MSTPHLRPLGFGEVLDTAFGLYRRHFVTLFATALIALLPLLLIMTFFVSAAPTTASPDDPVYITFSLLLIPLSGAATVLLWGALTRQVSRALTGESVTVGDGMRRGLRASLPLLGATVLAFVLMYVAILAGAIGLGIVGFALAFLLPGGMGGAGGFVAGLVAVVGGFVGLLLWATGLFAVSPAVVVERCGPLRALRRSWGLSRGARMRLFGVMAVAWLITMLPTFAIMLVFGGAAAFVDPAAVQASLGTLVVQQIVNVAAGALATPFLVGTFVVLYYDRRVRTEGYDIEKALDDLAVAG